MILLAAPCRGHHPSFQPFFHIPFPLTSSYVTFQKPGRNIMCQVSATRYSRCQCVCRFRAEKSCEAGFSSSQLSCKEGRNIIMKVVVAPQPICFQCHDKMQTLLRTKYTSEARTIYERGRMEKWTERKIKGEVKRKLKVGSSEMARLGVVCGTTLPDPPA